MILLIILAVCVLTIVMDEAKSPAGNPGEACFLLVCLCAVIILFSGLISNDANYGADYEIKEQHLSTIGGDNTYVIADRNQYIVKLGVETKKISVARTNVIISDKIELKTRRGTAGVGTNAVSFGGKPEYTLYVPADAVQFKKN